MKVLAVFSGKGGAGKSTVAALLAIALAKKHKVALMDADINTPSTTVLFGKRSRINENLEVFSTGFTMETDRAITFTGTFVRKILKELADDVQESGADVCVIDMPPSTGDIQLEVCSRLKPSSFLLVVQPNALCIEDALRATVMFMKSGIPVAGTIDNMVGDVFGKKSSDVLGLPVLATLPLREDIAKLGSSGKIDTVENNPLEPICEQLLKSATEITWKQAMKAKKEFTNKVIESGALDEEIWKKREYMDLETWDYVRGIIQQNDPFPDATLVVESAESIGNMLDHLGEDKTGLFMVLHPPGTEITLFPGEIGVARLVSDGEYSANNSSGRKSYYGIPRVRYRTDEGELVLFSHEIAPIDTQTLMELLNDGDVIAQPGSTIQRYLPSPKAMREAEYTFGLVHKGWVHDYKRMGLDVSEVMTDAEKAEANAVASKG